MTGMLLHQAFDLSVIVELLLFYPLLDLASSNQSGRECLEGQKSDRF
jgi:hypothetical protein